MKHLSEGISQRHARENFTIGLRKLFSCLICHFDAFSLCPFKINANCICLDSLAELQASENFGGTESFFSDSLKTSVFPKILAVLLQHRKRHFYQIFPKTKAI